MKVFILLLSLALLISSLIQVQSLNILGVFPYEGKSHFFVFQQFMLELAGRGHNVTVISHFPQKTPTPNYHDIHVANIDILENVVPLQRSYVIIIGMSFYLIKFGTQDCSLLLANEQVQNLWKSNMKFDVVVVEQFNSDCSLGLAYKLGAPVVGVTSNIMMPMHLDRLGMKYNPSYMRFMFLEGGKPTLYQRVERTLLDMHFWFLHKCISQPLDQYKLSYYFDDIPPLEELARNIKIMLVYQHFSMFGNTMLPSNVKEVGGYHVAKVQPLPDNIRKFIEESKHGVIYVSFGSLLSAATTPLDKLQTIIDALSLLPQRVIWKWELENLPGNPKNIYLSKWLPQNDILAHPKVVAFYSHCGLLGTTEAIHHGVPMVAMPIFGDQPANAAAVEESGLGVQIQLNELTTEKLVEKFKTVLDPKFKEKVKQLSKVWHDRPMSAMDTAVYWTEFAARNANLTMRSPAVDVPLYQYYCLDVAAVLLLLTLVPVYVIKSLITLLICKKKKTKKE